ncbi:TonB-dependent receptor [Sphingomonas lycopersici]|uniref:TonB-dependent receptor n=1 Tax=Sphingomonas lycopersici TaxID=2951807 RepID=A0AA41Z4D2_9SPHN|nr:TonB-dependent receptor [Sphingomonas lycopersici]MCW6533827.1 TonB-dependent receptor [Sphingomonas lycopersici]
MIRLRVCASSLAVMTTIALAPAAHAQTQGSDGAAANAGVGEIVVTAQKRAESVQNVPISIAAFEGATLEKANVVTVLDLGQVATNFQTVRSSNTGSTRIGIRGVGSLANTLIEPSVAVFVDGVYVPRSGSILGTFLDVGSVEVLRGPQGTLFGRNASVGALSISSALPRNEFSGEVTGEIGSFDRYKLSGFVNVPLTDNVSARFAGMGQWYQGPWKNRLDGKRYGGSDDMSFRGTVKGDFGNLEWIVRGDYTRLDGDGVSNFDFDPRSVSPARLAFIQAAFNGGPDTNLNDREMNQFVNSGLIDENWGVSSTASLRVGGSTFKLINSYRRWTNDQLDGDIVFFPVSLLSRRSLFDSKSQNHELQFISPEKAWLGGRFDMVAGLYYFDEDFALGEDLNLGSQFCSLLVAAGAARTACSAYYTATGGNRAAVQKVFQNVRSIAAYGQGNLYLTDRLTLTLGGRWTNDRKSGNYDQVSSPFTQTIRAPEALTFPGIDQSRFTYRLSLNYKPASDILLFVNHSTGYKSAGYNSGPGSPSLSTFDPAGDLVSTRRLFQQETVKNYEAGIKAKWLDRKLTTNITFYRMDIAGFQDRAFDGVSFIVRNAGSLRQQGFELDLAMAPTRNFSVSASMAYLDSKFTSYLNAANLPGLGGTQDLTGKPNTFSPKWSGNVTVDWRGDIGSSGMSWAANANLSFVSDQYNGTVLDTNPQTLADGYALLGARLTLNGRDDRWSLSIFARNLTDTHYQPLSVYQPLGAALGLNNTIFPGSTANRIQASEPRTFGAAATVRF